jgi:hypothetical protein
VIPIAPALAPYLQGAIDSSPSDLVFPWPMRSPECDPEKVLRHASVTTTTRPYGHLALDDVRDAVARIGPEIPLRFADSC